MSSCKNHPAVENGLLARSFLVSRCAGDVLRWLKAPLLFSNGPVKLLLELFRSQISTWCEDNSSVCGAASVDYGGSLRSIKNIVMSGGA